MSETSGSSELDDAALLGIDVLAQIVEHSSDGVSLCDADRRLVYINAAGAQMLGMSQAELIGQDCTDMVAATSRQSARESYPQLLSAAAEALYAPFVTADGVERELVYASHPVDHQGEAHVAAMFRDLSEPRAAALAAAALGQSGTDLMTEESVGQTLTGIARHAVERLQAFAATILVIGEHDDLQLAGEYAPAGPMLEGVVTGQGHLVGRSAAQVLHAVTGCSEGTEYSPDQPGIVRDLRRSWRDDPLMRRVYADLPEGGWRTALCVPLTWDAEVIGVLLAFVPVGAKDPTEPEIAFCAALADHAAAAVANARLTRQLTNAAALSERSLLIRELHDSVSQVLFAMAMRAGSAELLLQQVGHDDDSSLRRSVQQLVQLTRGAHAEMRALIFQLRPDALVEDGLVGALIVHAAALSAREQMDVVVDAPGSRMVIDAGVEEHLYRIVCEALHNTVKHASAGHAIVRVRDAAGVLEIDVIDDGVGFDLESRRSGHLGLTTMTQRARLIGAELTIVSGPGTTISLRVPLGASSSASFATV